MTVLGLLLIIVAWLLQLKGKARIIKKEFVAIYVAGVFLLALDGLISGVWELAILNTLSWIAALLVLLKIKKR